MLPLNEYIVPVKIVIVQLRSGNTLVGAEVIRGLIRSAGTSAYEAIQWVDALMQDLKFNDERIVWDFRDCQYDYKTGKVKNRHVLIEEFDIDHEAIVSHGVIEAKPVVDAKFVTEWSNGQQIVSDCKYDPSTRRAFDIQIVNGSDELGKCVGRWVIYQDKVFHPDLIIV